MSVITISPRSALISFSACAALFAAGAASAHHGWAWAETEQEEIRGTIATVTIAPPHPSLRVKAQDGTDWQVELGNPNQTKRAGFVEGSAKAGQEVVVLGNRSKDASENRIKAVRITVEGKAFDFYPERIKN